MLQTQGMTPQPVSIQTLGRPVVLCIDIEQLERNRFKSFVCPNQEILSRPSTLQSNVLPKCYCYGFSKAR